MCVNIHKIKLVGETGEVRKNERKNDFTISPEKHINSWLCGLSPLVCA